MKTALRLLLRRSNDGLRGAFSRPAKRTPQMPRDKNRPADDAAADDAAHGFAVLEAKVKEIQAEAAIEAEAAAAPQPAATAELPRQASALPDLTSPVTAMLRGYQDYAQSALRFHSETLESFAQVRGPQDLLAAQIAFGQRALEFQMGSWARLAGTLPGSYRPGA